MCSRSGVAFVLALEMSGVLGCAPRGVAGRSGIRVATDVVYARRDGQDLLADVHSPASGGNPFPGVLVVHGAGTTEWAMDQALRSEACSAVLGWANPRDPQALRRLQLAAEQSQSLAVLFRPLQAGLSSSPAVLRLALFGDAQQGLQVRIVKSRGGRPATVSLGH